MNVNGWTKTHRSTLVHSWLATDPLAYAAWGQAISLAEYRGAQCGRVNLSEVPMRAVVSPKVWRRILARFVAEGMLEIEGTRGRGARGGRGVDQYAWIVNYQKYQGQGREVEEAEDPTSTALAEPVADRGGERSGQRARGMARGRARGRAPGQPRETPTSTARAAVDESAEGARLGERYGARSVPSSRPKNLEELEEERKGHERTVRGASPVASPPTERAHTSSSEELDLDREPPRPPPAPDEIDMDPRLHPEHALMDRMNGKPTALQLERDARSFFTRLLGAANARDRQVQPRMRDWYEQYGPEYITRVWDEARNSPDPKNPRSSALYYLVDALNGRFYPRAAATRKTQAGGALHVPDGLVEGQPVLLPNGEQRVLEVLDGRWANVEGIAGVISVTDIRPVQEVRS